MANVSCQLTRPIDPALMQIALLMLKKMMMMENDDDGAGEDDSANEMTTGMLSIH